MKKGTKVLLIVAAEVVTALTVSAGLGWLRYQEEIELFVRDHPMRPLPEQPWLTKLYHQLFRLHGSERRQEAATQREVPEKDETDKGGSSTEERVYHELDLHKNKAPT